MTTFLISAGCSVVALFIGHLWGYSDGFKEGHSHGFFDGHQAAEKAGLDDVRTTLKN